MLKLILKKLCKLINVLILTISLILSGLVIGCGFHFLEKYEFPEYLNKVIIVSLDHINEFNSDFYLQLKNTFKNHGINVVNIKKSIIQVNNKNVPQKNINNISILHIAAPIIDEKIHSYNSQGQITTKVITASCSYQLFNYANNLLHKSVIDRHRTYSINSNQLLSSIGERHAIIQELELEIINELLKQLSVEYRVANKSQR